MRVGAVVPYWLDRPAVEALDVVRTAEAVGLDEVWIGEMLSFDAFVLAGAAARETSRIPLRVGPLGITIRTPVGIAMGMAGLQALAGPERVGLALGASTRAVAAGWHGRAWDHLPERMAASIEIIRTVLAGERSASVGPVGSDGFRLGIPAEVPDVAVAAFGPRMRAVARTVADRLVLNIVTPETVRRVVADVAPLPVSVWVTAGLEPSVGAVEAVKRQLALYVAAPGYGEMLGGAGFGELVDAARDGLPVKDVARRMPSELMEAVGAIGSEATVAERLGRYEAAGADAVALVPLTWDDPGGERLFRSVARRP